MTKNGTTGAGIGFPGLLTITFIILKLTGVIAWSWWWVLAPMWGGLAIILLLSVFFWIIAVIKLLNK